MASGDRESNSQGSRSFDIRGVVLVRGSSENHKNQHESDEELDAKALKESGKIQCETKSSLKSCPKTNKAL